MGTDIEGIGKVIMFIQTYEGKNKFKRIMQISECPLLILSRNPGHPGGAWFVAMQQPNLKIVV